MTTNYTPGEENLEILAQPADHYIGSVLVIEVGKVRDLLTKQRVDDVLKADSDAKLRVMSFEQGRDVERAAIVEKVEAIRPGACECDGGTYQCAHWGSHETIDRVLSLLNPKENE